MDRLRIIVTRRLDYSLLKGLHNLSAGALGAILIHVVLASSTAETIGRTLFMALWGGASLGSWVYHTLIRPIVLRTRALRVSSVIRHTDTVTEIRMVSPSAKPPRYTAGQFSFFRFPSSAVGREEHPFTLSSSPHEDFAAITVKNLGNYTSRIHLLKEGDSALLDGPYGTFTVSPRDKGPFLFIAGGIGITPFHSILKCVGSDDPRRFILFWAVRKREDLVYDSHFRSLESRLTSFRYIPVISDEAPLDSEERGFITPALLRKHCESLSTHTVYFCGPQAMRRAVFKGLKSEGFPARKIRYEMFSLG